MTNPNVLQAQLHDRRRRLETALRTTPANENLVELLSQVDAALERMDQGTYGLCLVCHDPIEAERLAADPLITVCLGDLSDAEQRALEQDLALAARVQASLLPEQEHHVEGWEVFYHYAPAGPVSGDYCDVLREDGHVLFLIGDVAGKGVAASMLMAALQATFRSLAGSGLPLQALVEKANRLFSESMPASHFATLAAVRASPDGEAEICNAGHCPVLVVSARELKILEPNNLPIGLFRDARYSAERISLAPGDCLLMFTDGLSEACNPSQAEFGIHRVCDALRAISAATPKAVVDGCLGKLKEFVAGVPPRDDMTVMAARKQ